MALKTADKDGILEDIQPGTCTCEEHDEVLDVFRSHETFMLTTHENPDGDALGSMLAMNEGLQQLGKDVVMYMPEDEFPLPHEYHFMGLDSVTSTPPDDWSQRTLVFVDCGNSERMQDKHLKSETAFTVNIDHHHDNTCFGNVNLVVPEASSTAEIIYGVLKGLGTQITVNIARALYVAVVTDTGKFMYKNTGSKTHLMAAELIQCGVDPYDTYKDLYEDLPFAKIALLARVLSRVERYDNGSLTMAQLLREDYDYTEAEVSFSEGIIDHLRAVRDTKVAVLVRELLKKGERKYKVSLRATDDRIDVSVIARNAGGGGHAQAAGFTSDIQIDKLIVYLRSEIQKQLSE